MIAVLCSRCGDVVLTCDAGDRICPDCLTPAELAELDRRAVEELDEVLR
jgi:uncharacterized Zn finger protein (UPF0148 family)